METDIFKMMALMEQDAGHSVTDYASLMQLLAQYSAVEAAAAFASLTLLPKYQSNLSQLERAIHCCLSFCHGQQQPNKALIQAVFHELEKIGIDGIGDPAEDVFASRLWLGGKSYQVHLGLWEGCIYQTQIFLNVLAAMPNTALYTGLHEQIKLILEISDKCLKKNNVVLNKVASTFTANDTDSIDFNDIYQVNLAEENVTNRDILPILAEADWQTLDEQKLGNSSLEESPFIIDDDKVIFILPTAVTVTIRRLIFTFCYRLNLQKEFAKALAHAQAGKLRETEILREFPGLRIKFTSIDNVDGWQASEVVVPLENKAWFHFIFLLDCLKDIQVDWFTGFAETGSLAAFLGGAINKAKQRVIAKIPDAKGRTIIVPCVHGRGISLDYFFENNDNWLCEIISVYDLDMISHDSDCNARKFWRILEAQHKVEKMGAKILNFNGFLNLYAFAKENNYSLLPQTNFHSESANSNQVMITIGSDFRSTLRERVLNDIDLREVAHPVLGNLIVSRGFANSEFVTNDKYDLYCETEADPGFLRVVYLGETTLWIEQNILPEVDFSVQYQLFNAALGNVALMVRVLASNGLPTERVDVWQLQFAFPDDIRASGFAIEKQQVRDAAISSLKGGLLQSTFGVNLIYGLHLPTNIAERTIILSFISALNFSQSVNEEAVLNSIFLDDAARHIHFFAASGYRELLSYKFDEAKPIVVEETDEKNIKLGLGWIKRDKGLGNLVEGKTNCKIYLNSVVGNIWFRLQQKLRKIDRATLIQGLLINVELCEYQKNKWERTFKANLSMREDTTDLYAVASSQTSKFIGASLASRLVVEMAICESPTVGGYKAGVLDIQELLCLALTMHHLGGVSESINYDCMAPKIIIAAFGDVLYDHSFNDAILTPYQTNLHRRQFDNAAATYEKHFIADKPLLSVKAHFERLFLDAWQCEFGFEVDDCKDCLYFIDRYGWHLDKLVFEVQYQELMNDIPQDKKDVFKRVIDSLLLYSRSSWTAIPPKYKSSDWQPWKFRRRFSILHKPIVQINDDKLLIISPEHIRRGVKSLLIGAYEAVFDENHFSSIEMRRWIGLTRRKAGRAFNSAVARIFKEHGWHLREEIKLPEVLNKKMTDHGDIDVLAWNESKKIVLVIECKDLAFAKSQGEVARQLNEFKGVKTKKGKDDRLRKHVVRSNALVSDMNGLAKFVKIDKKELQLQSYVVFSEMVPMNFVDSTVMQDNVSFMNLEQLEQFIVDC